MARGDIFRKSYSVEVPPGAERVKVKGIPSARFKRNGKTITAPLVKGRDDRALVQSPSYYGTVDGKAVLLFADAVASRQRLAELRRKVERHESGLADPFEQHRRRPLTEHIDDWRTAMVNEGSTAKHAGQYASSVRRIVAGCKFAFITDISASHVQQFLADFRKDQPAATLDPSKESYSRAELAHLLGVGKCDVSFLIKRHRLAATGVSRARRYPAATAAALLANRGRGASIRTSNQYLAAMKAFCNWLVKDRRTSSSVLSHLSGGNVELDRRHGRRILDEGELRLVMGEAGKSGRTFRDMTGVDREMLYLTACGTGFRAGELAALCPRDFMLDGSPVVTLDGEYTKNGKAAMQPISSDVAERLRAYLVGRKRDQPVWPGTWHERASDMLRIDLDAAGIPYTIDGPDGLQHVDFHALRHSYVRLLDKAGATLKEAMQLARHSDPRLTMKVYGKARQSDLASVVERLPDMSHMRFACRSDDVACGNVTNDGEVDAISVQRIDESQVVDVIADDRECGEMIGDEVIIPDWIRTSNLRLRRHLVDGDSAAQNPRNDDVVDAAHAVRLPFDLKAAVESSNLPDEVKAALIAGMK